MTINIAAFSGSLRKESYTTKLVKAFQASAPSGVTLEIIDISQLPLINEDLELDLPSSVQALHATVRKADAILLATPEYNRSYSPVIKNALDWGSRPDGQNLWDAKPAAVIGATLYNLGTFGAQQHLRQVMMYLNMYSLQQPEFYLEKAASKFSPDGKLTDAKTRAKVDELWEIFVAWIALHKK